jgi:hypothetical protein
MPRAIQPVKVGKKRYYAVFSTISMDFLTPFYKSVRALRKDLEDEPEFKKLKVYNLLGSGTKATIEGSRIIVRIKVYRIDPKSGKWKEGYRTLYGRIKE